MRIELVRAKSNTRPGYLHQGQLAEIVKCPVSPESVGKIVVRHKNDLLTVGYGSYWSDVFDAGGHSMEFRPLEPGDTIACKKDGGK